MIVSLLVFKYYSGIAVCLFLHWVPEPQLHDVGSQDAHAALMFIRY